jgi:hypothetical protein
MSSVEDILAEYADGLAAGSLQAQDLIQKYDIQAHSELAALLKLAQALETILVEVEPSPEFVLDLRRELLHEPQTVLHRLSKLSNSQMGQLAAGLGGLTLAAGILWLAGRSYLHRREGATLSKAAAS